jgi:hypothetical protein
MTTLSLIARSLHCRGATEPFFLPVFALLPENRTRPTKNLLAEGAGGVGEREKALAVR